VVAAVEVLTGMEQVVAVLVDSELVQDTQ